MTESSSSIKEDIKKLLGSETVFFSEKCEVKGKKAEERVCIVTSFRVIFVSFPKVKIQIEAKLLDIQGIKVTSDHDIQFTFNKTGIVTASFNHTSQVIGCITSIRTEFKKCFPAAKQTPFKLECDDKFKEKLPERDVVCGGFVQTFRLLANNLGLVVHDEICWDIEHILAAQKLTTINLNEFECLSPTDVKLIMTTLRYNTYFRGLEANDFPLAKDKIQAESTFEMIKHNSSLEYINFTNICAGASFFTNFFGAAALNKKLMLRDINLSGNVLEAAGAAALAKVIETSTVGFTSLTLAGCSLDKKAGTIIGLALKKNTKFATSLTNLNLSHNKIDSDGSSSIAAFLAVPNVIQELNLADTNSNMEVVAGAIMRGCPELRTINLSQNKFTPKADFLQTWITSSANLKVLDISGTGINPESFRGIITAINGNAYMHEVTLRADSNGLGLAGAQVLVDCAKKWNSITKLSVSNNGFEDEGVAMIANAFCSNTCLESLSIGANISAKHVKKGPNVSGFSSLIDLIESDCPLNALNVAGSKLVQPKLDDLLNLIYAIGVNDTITSLDVSCNGLGNKGVMALGKAIQTNKRLESLAWDDNGTQLMGFQAFLVGMERNTSLKRMTMPYVDIANCMKEAPSDKICKICSKIQHCLYLNQNPSEKKKKNDTSFDAVSNFLQQSALDTQVQRIKRDDKNGVLKQAENAQVLKDVENAEAAMNELLRVREDAKNELEMVVRRTMNGFTETLAANVDGFKNKFIRDMQAVISQLHTLTEDDVKRLSIAVNVSSKPFNKDVISPVFMNKTATEVIQLANDSMHSQVETASDYVYEKLGESLDNIMESIQKARREASQNKSKKLGDSFSGSFFTPQEPTTAPPSNTPKARGAAGAPPQGKLPIMMMPRRPPPSRKPPREIPKLGNSVLSKATHTEQIGPQLEHHTKNRAKPVTKARGKGGRRPPSRLPRPTRRETPSNDLL